MIQVQLTLQPDKLSDLGRMRIDIKYLGHDEHGASYFSYREDTPKHTACLAQKINDSAPMRFWAVDHSQLITTNRERL